MNVTNKKIKYSQLQINFEDSMQEDNAEHESNAGTDGQKLQVLKHLLR
jgi:hypothetical protein